MDRLGKVRGGGGGGYLKLTCSIEVTFEVHKSVICRSISKLVALDRSASLFLVGLCSCCLTEQRNVSCINAPAPHLTLSAVTGEGALLIWMVLVQCCSIKLGMSDYFIIGSVWCPRPPALSTKPQLQQTSFAEHVQINGYSKAEGRRRKGWREVQGNRRKLEGSRSACSDKSIKKGGLSEILSNPLRALPLHVPKGHVGGSWTTAFTLPQV